MEEPLRELSVFPTDVGSTGDDVQFACRPNFDTAYSVARVIWRAYSRRHCDVRSVVSSTESTMMPSHLPGITTVRYLLQGHCLEFYGKWLTLSRQR